MIILGIETSCDDTSAAVIGDDGLMSNVISTQLVHKQFGGVVPELASRAHSRLVLPVIRQALNQAKVKKKDLQGIAVTYGPGLVGSLLVGLSTAKGLALSLDIPVRGVNHLEGHIFANRLDHHDLNPPFVTLIVSGGHTQLVYVCDWGRYEVLGRTRDDAAGEAFDKVGKLLELGYPGGPVIEKQAEKGDSTAIRFPRAYLDPDGFDFSFSGLKTAVLNHVREIGPDQTRSQLHDICASFQDAVVEVLIQKSISAAKSRGGCPICLAGGVAVNGALRHRMTLRGGEENLSVYWPSAACCTDNGGMIAEAGRFYLEKDDVSPLSLSPAPSLNF